MLGVVGRATSATRFWRKARLTRIERGPGAHRARFARGRIWGAAILSWACATPIHAGQSGFGLGLSLAHESNIFRVEANPQSEWIRALMFGLFYQENTIDLTAHVLAQVERRHFYRQTFSDDTGGFLDGAAVWTILPRRLTWAVDDVFREVQLNIADPTTPSNLTKSNSLNTGPDFTFPLSSTNSAVIGGRYGRFDIQNSVNDTRRYTAYGRGLHALSPQTKVSLNYEASRVYFEPGAQVISKILREDWFARYENLSAANSMTIDVGTSRVTQYGGTALEGNRLVRLALSEALSSRSTVRMGLADQISDTYSDLIAGVTRSTAPSDTGVAAFSGTTLASGDLYRSKRGDFAYTNNDGRLQYTLQVYGRRVDFETLDQDYQERGGTFSWIWAYTGAMQFNASARYMKRTFSPVDPASPLSGRQDADRIYGAGVTYRLNSNVTVTMEGGHTKHQSTVLLSSFVDNRAMLLLGYSSGPYEVRPRR